MLTIHTTGNWPRGAVRATLGPSTRQIIPQVDSLIESAWRDPLGGVLASPDEFRLVTEFGKDRIQDDAAERIVLDAENA